MLYPMNKLVFSKIIQFILCLSLLALLSACMPQTSTPSVNRSGTTGTTPNTTDYADPTFPLTGLFIQEGAIQTQASISLPVNFSDSFLMRGSALSQYLRKLPNTTKYCLVGRYNYTGNDNFMILTAKPKSFTDAVAKTTEYYLQVEPSNDVANQNDCLSYNLTNTLFTGATTPSASFSLSQLCANCSSAVSSTGLKLYFINGEQVPTLNLGTLNITVAGNSSTGGASSCSESTACLARGFDCCLDSQCVSDGAVRPGAIALPGFTAAQEDVRLNPTRFVVYPQYYFVCNTTPSTGTTSGSGGGGTTPDADYEAATRLMELTQLYQCLNKVDGEFSYCTVKFQEASKSIPGVFSASSLGFYDDVNFSTLNPNLNTGEYVNNIVKITYGGKTLYELKKTALTDATFVTSSANDNITTTQGVTITSALPTNAVDDNLYLTYKIDGTCVKVGTTISKCTKTYIQGSTDTYSTTYHNSTKTYLLPSYADLSGTSNIIVKVSGIIVPEDATSWTKYQTPNRIIFSGSYPIYQNQSVEITYFVTTNASELSKLRTAAQAQVNSMCTCGTSGVCNLQPVLDSTSSLSNYECVYPSVSTTEPPANQTIFVSNKNVPHRFYDTNGVNYDEGFSTAPDQELTAFSYTNSNVLKPSNVSTFTGFNEILGSFNKNSASTAQPAKLVKVKKDKTYDLIVNSGSFSSCITCGADYYSSLQKIFPQNFGGQGGGYTPDKYESRRELSSSIYRSDDLLYGRACFVPPTMIPWTHTVGTTASEQRVARLAGQHFLFANGYQKDWYGFDYGSLIGSFDGVTWFSIGNQRRIKASSSKLFIAVNSYFGDLNVDSNFNVLVSETTAFSNDLPDHDSETDGAECQKSHYCSTDNDCVRQLGYDYSCQSVAGLTTPWPQFDGSSLEVIGSTTRTLSSLVGGTNGQAKRCMYRGRGSPCLNNLLNASSTTFNGSSLPGALACSANHSCSAVNLSRFNDRISRFANTPASQNLSVAASTNSDIVGLGARIIGRPFDYYGTKAAPTAALNTLTQTLVNAICIPGKDISGSQTTYDLNARTPSTRTETSDRILNVGSTIAGTGPNSKYLNACPATDTSGTSLNQASYSLTDAYLSSFAVTQNLSSNLLDTTALRNLNVFNTISGSLTTAVGLQRNSCLRAPGSACFSDLECAPSSFVASKVKTLATFINTAEKKYWEEELTCGNPDFKTLSNGAINPNYDIKKNTCCREIGKVLTVYTQTSAASTYQWCDTTVTPNQIKVAGVNTAIDSTTRYSRVHSGYDKMTCNVSEVSSTKTFALSLVAANSTDRLQQILGQYKTLDTINQRTCCTQNWVRSFSTDNGGGHKFARTKLQTVDKEMFKHVSWFGEDNSIPGVIDAPFECDPTNFANASCEVRSITPADEEKYLTWAASLELIGIPQVAVKTDDEIYKLVDDSQVGITITAASTSKTPLNNSILDIDVVGEDFTDASNGNNRYYSAASYSKFNMTTGGLKKVFSENEFNCCVPSGQQVTDTTTAEQCCTGNVANSGSSTLRRCCLPDFTDVTLYLNRYVSSEGRGLPDSAYDQATGYIKDSGQVRLMVAQKNLCCSGQTMTGVAISNLSIPITNGTYLPPTQINMSRRFNYRSDSVDNNAETGSIGSIFDAGVRWNNHVYCVPAGFATSN